MATIITKHNKVFKGHVKGIDEEYYYIKDAHLENDSKIVFDISIKKKDVVRIESEVMTRMRMYLFVLWCMIRRMYK